MIHVICRGLRFGVAAFCVFASMGESDGNDSRLLVTSFWSDWSWKGKEDRVLLVHASVDRGCLICDQWQTFWDGGLNNELLDSRGGNCRSTGSNALRRLFAEYGVNDASGRRGGFCAKE